MRINHNNREVIMTDKYWTVLEYLPNSDTPGRIAINATYGDQVWDSPIYEVIGYADKYLEAKQIARARRMERNSKR